MFCNKVGFSFKLKLKSIRKGHVLAMHVTFWITFFFSNLKESKENFKKRRKPVLLFKKNIYFTIYFILGKICCVFEGRESRNAGKVGQNCDCVTDFFFSVYGLRNQFHLQRTHTHTDTSAHTGVVLAQTHPPIVYTTQNGP